VGPSEEEARAGLQRKRPRARPGEVVLGARESFLERSRVRPGEVVPGARESFPEKLFSARESLRRSCSRSRRKLSEET